jgi:hypothetical protein
MTVCPIELDSHEFLWQLQIEIDAQSRVVADTPELVISIWIVDSVGLIIHWFAVIVNTVEIEQLCEFF